MSEQDLERRVQLYSERLSISRRIGRKTVNHLRIAETLDDPIEKEQVIAEFKTYATEYGPTSDEQFGWWQAAAKARRGERGENLDVSVGYILPSDIEEMAELLRIHPAVRAAWSEHIAAGDMKMIAAFEGIKPAARVNLTFNGPTEVETVPAFDSPIPWVDSLWTNEPYRFHGIGTRLMLACEDEVKRHPGLAQALALSVQEDNPEARYLYEKLGYQHRQVDGEDTFEAQPDIVGTEPVRKVLMVKDLKQQKDIKPSSSQLML